MSIFQKSQWTVQLYSAHTIIFFAALVMVFFPLNFPIGENQTKMQKLQDCVE